MPLALTALAYFATGLAALPLAIPPAFASPLYPAAGVALASVLVFGWRMLGGVALGALARQRRRSMRAARHRRSRAVVACRSSIALGGDAAGRRRRGARAPLRAPAADADRAARHRRLPRLLRRRAASSAPASATLALCRAGAMVTAANARVDLGDLVDRRPRRPADRDADRPHPDRPAALASGRRAALPVGLTMTLVVAFLGLGIVQASRWNERAPARARSRTTRRGASLDPRQPSSTSRCARSRRCAASSPSSAT